MRKKRDIEVVLFDNSSAIDVYHTTGARRLQEDISSLDLTTIKHFLHFYVAINRGRIKDERITVDPVKTLAE